MDYGAHGDEEIALAAALQGIPLEQAKLQQRMRRAQGLMETPLPQGQQMGRIYRAASPFEALASALSRGLGARDMRQAEQEWGGLAQRAQQAGLARMKMERADKERGFGLQERGLARQEAAEASKAQAIQERAAETARHNRATEARNAGSSAGWGGPLGQGPTGGEGSPVAAIAESIVKGEQPPDTKGLYRWAGPLRAELARRGFDLGKANLDWQATQKNLATLNGPQQLRIRQAAMTANESLSNIENLYQEWKQLGGTSGLKLFNRASLALAKNAPGRMGAVAQALEMNIADLTSELGVVYMGGNTPTDHALELAGKNLSANWNEQQFSEAVKQARQNLGYRLNSIKHSGPVGIGGPSRYAPEAPSEAAPPQTPATATQDLRKKYGL